MTHEMLHSDSQDVFKSVKRKPASEKKQSGISVTFMLCLKSRNERIFTNAAELMRMMIFRTLLNTL